MFAHKRVTRRVAPTRACITSMSATWYKARDRTATPDDRLIGRPRPFLKEAGELLPQAPSRAYPHELSMSNFYRGGPACHPQEGTHLVLRFRITLN
jgi:hypothetical protein